MKRKILSMLMAIIMAVSCSVPANAEVIVYKKYKGFKYERIGNEIGIHYYNGKKAKAVIPAKIKGIKVKSVNLIRAKGLKSIRLSRYVKYAYLAKIRSLKKVTVDKKNKYLSAKNNMVLNKKKIKLISVLGGYDVIKIPKTVKTIEVASFSGSKVEKVIVTKNVKRIYSPFNGCRKLKEIIFEGDSIPKISEESFGYSSNLNFYVKTEELAYKLLKKLQGKQSIYARIYVGDKLVCEQQLSRDYYQ